MDHYTMKALWIYWARGDDEVELTDEESSYFEDENEVTKIFRIETIVFDFETPLCRAFKEFNYLLQIDLDVLTKDIEGFKTYEDYMDDWIYEWNKDVPWVHEKPWTKNGVWKEPTLVKHYLIMEYLVKISKKARILELKQRHLKFIVLTSYTSYPSRKIWRICACTLLKTTKEQDPISRLRKKYRLSLKNDMPPRDK
ncbi:hypothetical protein Tco_0290635 [Tanacetum coccineum]